MQIIIVQIVILQIIVMQMISMVSWTGVRLWCLSYSSRPEPGAGGGGQKQDND